MGDMGSIGKRLFYWSSTHDPRTFVERVDWISCAGYLGGGDERARLGLEGGPELVVSNLAVMDFEPESKRMRLRTVHPGVTVEQVQEATGFPLLVADDVAETRAADGRGGPAHPGGDRPGRHPQGRVPRMRGGVAMSERVIEIVGPVGETAEPRIPLAEASRATSTA